MSVPKFKPVQVEGLDALKKGEHISVKRCLRYSHHMILEEKPTVLTKVKVIEYGNKESYASSGMLKCCGKSGVPVAVVRRASADLSSPIAQGKVYRRDYDPDKCAYMYTLDETVKRAINKLGDENYGLWNNNCEHFATWCRTGVHHSSQVQKVKKIMKKATQCFMGGTNEPQNSAHDAGVPGISHSPDFGGFEIPSDFEQEGSNSRGVRAPCNTGSNGQKRTSDLGTENRESPPYKLRKTE